MELLNLALRQLDLVGSPVKLVPFSVPVIVLLYIFSELVDVPKGMRFSIQSIKEFIVMNVWVMLVFSVQFAILWSILIIMEV